MKKCRICGQIKELSLFYKRASSPDGHRNDCIDCHVARSQKNYYANHEENKEYRRKHYAKLIQENPNWHAENYAKNREHMLKQCAFYYKTKHRDKVLQRSKEWAQKNPGRANANKKAYKIAKIKACPPWVREDEDLMWMIAEAYELAALRTKMFGFAWHVDHKIPLRGKTVSGLHVPWNLQVIPGVENMSKSNKLVGV